MSDEDAFQTAIDAEPDNHFLRMVFADWLDDMGDPRGPGYRALGVLEKNPGTYCHRAYFGRDSNVHYGISKYPEGQPYLLPDDWFLFVESNYQCGGDAGCWCYQDGRRNMEDAAALAFSRLSAERQAELLRATPAPAPSA